MDKELTARVDTLEAIIIGVLQELVDCKVELKACQNSLAATNMDAARERDAMDQNRAYYRGKIVADSRMSDPRMRPPGSIMDPPTYDDWTRKYRPTDGR